MILDRSKFENKNDFLWYILNNLGCNDLALCYSYRAKDGSLRFSKWYKYMALLHLDFNDNVPATNDTREGFIRKVSHRTILDIEVCIDLDEKGKYKSIRNKAKSIARKLKKAGIKYKSYFSGSRSYHFSILFPKLRDANPEARKEFKSHFLSWIGADAQKASERSMIALEGEPHYKSGKNKKEVQI